MLVSSKEAIGFAKLSQLEIGGNLLHFAKHLQIANRAVVAHVTFGTFALIPGRELLFAKNFGSQYLGF